MADQADGLLSPWLRRQRINMARPHIQGKVLDLGCGVGALAEICHPESYFGVDTDEESIEIARKKYPTFRFEKKYPENEQFDTIVLLAVIEHIKDRKGFLKQIKLKLMPNGRIILTTPHPLIERVHSLGPKIGLFSAHANEDHEQLIDHDRMQKLVSRAGLIIFDYKHFLLGANQLYIIGHK